MIYDSLSMDGKVQCLFEHWDDEAWEEVEELCIAINQDCEIDINMAIRGPLADDKTSDYHLARQRSTKRILTMQDPPECLKRMHKMVSLVTVIDGALNG